MHHSATFGKTAAVFLLTLLAACASEKRYSSRDLPFDLQPYQGLVKIGDSYQVNGVWHTPKYDPAYDEVGYASWYGPGFHGNQTASGERFNQEETTAAHRTLPLPSMVRVTNLENGEEIIVRVNDRGPFTPNRIIDLSRKSAELLGIHGKGTAKVRVQYLKEETLRYLASLKGVEYAAMPQTPDAAQTADYYANMRGGQSTAADTSTPQVSAREISATDLVGSPLSAAPSQPPAAMPDPPTPLEDFSGEAEPSRPVTPLTGKGYYVQAGAFADASNAQRLSGTLSRIGSTHVSPVVSGGRTLHRVRIGPVDSAAEARSLLARVADMGYGDAKVVKE